MMIDIVESWPRTKFADQGLILLHEADDNAVKWLEDVATKASAEWSKHLREVEKQIIFTNDINDTLFNIIFVEIISSAHQHQKGLSTQSLGKYLHLNQNSYKTEQEQNTK